MHSRDLSYVFRTLKAFFWDDQFGPFMFVFFIIGGYFFISSSGTQERLSMLSYLASISSGIALGASSELFFLKFKQDSVLRYAFWDEGNAHHIKLRSNFCAIVNDKSPLLDSFGFEVGALQIKVQFYRTVGGLVLITLVPLWLFELIIGGVKHFSIIWSCLLFLVCFCVYIVLKRALRSSIHRAYVFDVDTQKHYVIFGERGEDGLPTKKLQFEEHTQGPGWFRYNFLIPK